MAGFSLLILLFMAYAFVGWACETIYCCALTRTLTNRGFLNGPLCPIYAVGAFGTLGMAQLVPHRIVVVFLLGLAVDTLVEYLTGTLLELVFHTKYWDYSEDPCNFQGRICLVNSLLFGAMSAALVFWIHPTVRGLLLRIPARAREWAAGVLLALFVADLCVSVATALKLNLRLKHIGEAMQAIREKLDTFGFETSASFRERLDRLAENRNSEPTATLFGAVNGILDRVHSLESANQLLQRRLLRAFPKIRSTRYPEYLSNIKAQFENRRPHKRRDTDSPAHP